MIKFLKEKDRYERRRWRKGTLIRKLKGQLKREREVKRQKV